jgi:transposase
MAIVTSILTLHKRGWSQRRIARELGVSRTTVRRQLARGGRDSNCTTNPPPGSGGRWGSGPASSCRPFREIIEVKLSEGLSGVRIWQDLQAEHGFAGSYDSVKRYLRRLGKTGTLPFRRMECAPGEQGQVDFGRGAPIVNGESRRRGSHVFRIVLGHSRKGYSEGVFRQTTDGFLGCLENAFWAFGGVPRTIVIDNLKAAVTKTDWFDPELNPKVQAFCEHYGTVILPAKPYMPRHKGKVERGIGYVRNNALKGRRFASLNEENRHLAEWEASVADTRIHGTTRQQVGKIFREVEQPALLALPAGRFGFFHEAQRMVHRDGHVEVAKAYYSVPPEYVGHRMWVRWDGRLVRVFTEGMEQIAVHAQHEPGRFSTRSEHIHSRKISSVERGATWLLGRAGRLGLSAERWARAMLQARGIQGVRVLAGLLSLTRRYRPEQIDRACEIALTHEAFRLRVIRELIRRGGPVQEEFEYLANHEIIRDLADYGELVTAAFRREPLPAATFEEEYES